jgi:hypothetical protein
MLVLDLEVEDGESPDREELGAQWLEPREHLALGDHETRRKPGDLL